jgi:hypothetical protein
LNSPSLHPPHLKPFSLNFAPPPCLQVFPELALAAPGDEHGTDDNESGLDGLGAGFDDNGVQLRRSGTQHGSAEVGGYSKMNGGVGEEEDEDEDEREAMLESLRLNMFVATEEGDTEAVERLLEQVAAVRVDYDTVCALGAEVRHVKGPWDGTSLYGWGDGDDDVGEEGEEEEEEDKDKEEEEEEDDGGGRESVCGGKKRVRKRDLKRIKKLAASIIEGWAAELIPKHREEVSGKIVHDNLGIAMRWWLLPAHLIIGHLHHIPNAEFCSENQKPVLQAPKLWKPIGSTGYESKVAIDPRPEPVNQERKAAMAMPVKVIKRRPTYAELKDKLR